MTEEGFFTDDQGNLIQKKKKKSLYEEAPFLTNFSEPDESESGEGEEE